MRYPAEHPAERRYIREHPNDIPRIGDELLRCFPVATLARMVAKDIVYNGVTMLKDEPILLPSVLYNLDESVFEAPLGRAWQIDLGKNSLAWREEEVLDLEGSIIPLGLQWYLIDRDDSIMYCSRNFEVTGTVVGEKVQGFFDQCYMPEGMSFLLLEFVGDLQRGYGFVK